MNFYQQRAQFRIGGGNYLIPVLNLGRQTLVGIFPPDKAQKIMRSCKKLVKNILSKMIPFISRHRNIKRIARFFLYYLPASWQTRLYALYHNLLFKPSENSTPATLNAVAYPCALSQDRRIFLQRRTALFDTLTDYAKKQD